MQKDVYFISNINLGLFLWTKYTHLLKGWLIERLKEESLPKYSHALDFFWVNGYGACGN